MITDEIRTIQQALDDDEAAQRRLYETHCPAAFRLAYLLLHNAGDAEEVVQDTFVYVFRNLARYDAERGTFWAWLRVTLVSRCRNKRRRCRLSADWGRTVSLDVFDANELIPTRRRHEGDPAGVLERLGVRRAIWDALQQVSQGAREALILRYYEGLPYAEIAEILGCSNDAARSRVVHGKAQLRRVLAQPQHARACGVENLVRATGSNQ